MTYNLKLFLRNIDFLIIFNFNCICLIIQEVSGYYFRVSAENEVGSGKANETDLVNLKAHASVPSPPTAPLEITPVSPTSIHVEWGAPESDGGAPLEGYKVAVRDAKRQMWMEVGRVDADVQRLKVQDLSEGNEYFVRYALINII